MTLLAELADAASGQMLARVADRREANGVGARSMQLADRMLNEDAAREVAAAWAQTLRKALDKARSIGS
jgi:predicted NBD/HSP70 family sugar kinase